MPLSGPALDVLAKARGLGDGGRGVPRALCGRGAVGWRRPSCAHRAGVDASPHGARSTFRAWAQSRGENWEASEISLSHRVGSRWRCADAERRAWPFPGSRRLEPVEQVPVTRQEGMSGSRRPSRALSASFSDCPARSQADDRRPEGAWPVPPKSCRPGRCPGRKRRDAARSCRGGTVAS